MSNLGHKAVPMRRSEIRDTANKIRQHFDVLDVPRFPILHVLENALPQLIGGYCFQVVDAQELRGVYAEALPAVPAIRVRADVYERARQGIPRDCFTLAHELGHLVLHTDHRLQRVERGHPIETFRDPEWQANAFAGELLLPLHLYKGMKNPKDACTVFGVSNQACEIQLQAWRREKLI